MRRDEKIKSEYKEWGSESMNCIFTMSKKESKLYDKIRQANNTYNKIQCDNVRITIYMGDTVKINSDIYPETDYIIYKKIYRLRQVDYHLQPIRDWIRELANNVNKNMYRSWKND